MVWRVFLIYFPFIRIYLCGIRLSCLFTFFLNHHLFFRVIAEELTSQYDDLGMKCERDAFDTLFDHAPDKLQVVKKSLITFANKHLNKINLEVVDLDNQFSGEVFSKNSWNHIFSHFGDFFFNFGHSGFKLSGSTTPKSWQVAPSTCRYILNLIFSQTFEILVSK